MAKLWSLANGHEEAQGPPRALLLGPRAKGKEGSVIFLEEQV